MNFIADLFFYFCVIFECRPDPSIGSIFPLFPALLNDPENIIRQHLAIQLLPVCLTCIGVPLSEDGLSHIPPTIRSDYDIYIAEDDEYSTFYDEYYEPGYKVVIRNAIPHLSKLICDIDPDVRKAASDSLAGLAAYMQNADVLSLIVPIAIRLSTSNTNSNAKANMMNPRQPEPEDLRITSVSLLASLARAVTSEILTEKIIPTLAPFSQDTGFKVRKALVHAIPRVITFADFIDIKTYLLPLFDSLSRDDMYRVRKACAESMVEMSGGIVIVSKRREEEEISDVLSLRRTVLIPMCKMLLGDSNRFVRHGMMQFLGPFIASFYPLDETSTIPISESLPNYFPHSTSPIPSTVSQNKTLLSPLKMALTSDLMMLEKVFQQYDMYPTSPQDLRAVKNELIPSFAAMSVLQSGDANIDAEMRVHCAYSLPAAALLLGRYEWDLLRDCFFALVNGSGSGSLETANNLSSHQGAPVLAAKRCLASSLHTLAHILGPDIVESELLPTFSHSFLRDPDEQTRLNTLKNLSSFLAVLSRKARESFLPILLEFKNSASSQHLNWRLRNIVTKQLSLLITLFDAQVVRAYMLPLMYAFIKDSVAQVREDTFVCVPIMLLAFSPDRIEKESRDRRHLDKNFDENIQEWAANASYEVVTWLREELGNNDNDFCMRQAFCRICAAIAMAITENFDDGAGEEKTEKTHRSTLSNSSATSLGVNSQFDDSETMDSSTNSVITQTCASSESFRFTFTRQGRKYLHKILVHDLISTALRMKDDTVANVRLTLFQCLRVMPSSVRSLVVVNTAMRQLADELYTWDVAESGGWTSGYSNVGNYQRKKSTKDDTSDTRSTPGLNSSPRNPKQSRRKVTGNDSVYEAASIASI